MMPRDANDKKKLEESSMHAELNKIKVAKEYEEKMQRIREKVDNSVRSKEIATQKGVNHKLNEASKHFQTVKKMHSGESPHSNKSMQVGTFFSWIMDSEPEFRAIVYTICLNAHAKRKQYVGDPASLWLLGKGAYGYYYLKESFSSEDIRQLPDIKYITSIDEDGKLNMEILQESFGDLLNDENGNFSEEKANEIQQILQGYISEWVDTLDGLGPNGLGYFMSVSGRPPERRLYSKEFGEPDPSGANWKIRPGEEDNFVKKEDFSYVIDGCGYPEKSFSSYLHAKCHDVNLEEDTSYRLGM